MNDAFVNRLHQSCDCKDTKIKTKNAIPLFTLLKKSFYLCSMETFKTTFRINTSLNRDVKEMVDAKCLRFSTWFTRVVMANMQDIGLIDEHGEEIPLTDVRYKEARRKSPYNNRGATIGWNAPKYLHEILHKYAATTDCEAANVSELLTMWLEAEMKKHVEVKPVNRFERKRKIEMA